MNDPYFLLFYPIALLILIFYGAGFSEKGKLAPEFLCPDQGRMIRGAACVGVVIHHLTQYVTEYGSYYKGWINVFNYCGILFTSVFFFFSGYGLITALHTKKDYLRGFIRKRLLTVFIPFWIINILELLANIFIYDIHYDAMYIFQLISGVRLLNSNGWFIIEISIFYLIFYLLFRFIKNEKAATALLCVFTAAVIVYAFYRGHDVPGAKVHWFKGEWWYNSTIAFPMGVIYAQIREKYIPFCLKHQRLITFVKAILFIIFFRLSTYAVDHFGYYRGDNLPIGHRYAFITLMIQMLACISFIAFIVQLNMKITLNDPVLRYLGNIGNEIFLVHGYFISRVFDDVRMKDFVRFGLVLICSIALSAVISVPVRRIAYLAAGKNESAGNSSDKKKSLEEGRVTKGASAVMRIKKLAGLIFKNKKTAFAFCLALILSYFLCRYLILETEYAGECETIGRAAIGDEVYWGHFDTDGFPLLRERLTWIVIKRDGDRVCLLSKKGISGYVYNHKHEEVSWENSDLRTYLNSDTFTGIFSRSEMKNMVRIDGDLITLLTAEEAKEAFESDHDRELDITRAAELKGTNINRMTKVYNWDMKGYRSSWWWLRQDPGEESVFAPIVTENGTVITGEKYVNKPKGAIRPVIWVSVSGT